MLCDCGDRSTAQAIALKEHLPVDMVMNLDVPRQIIVDRLTDRWIHPGSGRVYAYAYRPPKVHYFATCSNLGLRLVSHVSDSNVVPSTTSH